MPIDILDGFEDYPNVTGAGVGVGSTWSIEGSQTPQLVAGRVGGQAIRFSGTNNGGISRAVTPSSEFAIFHALYHNHSPGNTADTIFLRLYPGTNRDAYHLGLAVNRFDTLSLYGPTGNVIATEPLLISDAVWYSISMAGEIHDSLGWVKVWVDGELIFDVSNIDTQNAGGATVDRILFHTNPAFSDAFTTIDDVRYDSGTSVQIPEGRFAVLPLAADDLSDWTPLSGADNHLMIDDPTCDSDTTYNSSNTVGHIDRFTYSAIPFNPDNIMAVMVSMCARKEDVATRRVRSFILSDATQVNNADKFLSTNYTWDRHILELDPDGDVPWTKAALTALKAGYELME